VIHTKRAPRTAPRLFISVAVTVLLSVVLSTVSGAAGHAKAVVRAALPPGSIQHIIVIEFENEGFETTFGPDSVAPYLAHTLTAKGELLSDYYAIGHDSLDNYIAQVSGQSPTTETQADCLGNNFDYVDVTPGIPAPDHVADPGQVVGSGCVYPANVLTIANQLDAKYPPNRHTHVASWRAYEEDMGNTPARDGGDPDPSGGTDCGHPALNTPDTAEFATATDQYTSRHNPFVWFHSIIDNQAECDANVVPLGTLLPNGKPSPSGHLARDLRSQATTPRFAFITPNLCDDGHDDTCAGLNSGGTNVGGLVGANLFLEHWMPLILDSPAYRSGDTLVVVTFDEADVDTDDPTYAAACCNEQPGPNTAAPGDGGDTTDIAPGGGRIGAVLLNARYIKPGTVDTAHAYNHYSALRSYEDLLGLTTEGTDGEGHLGFAAAAGLAPFGRDVFNRPHG
jgi:hypothetical protein